MTIVAAVSLPESTAREEARTVMGESWVIVEESLLMGGVMTGESAIAYLFLSD